MAERTLLKITLTVYILLIFCGFLVSEARALPKYTNQKVDSSALLRQMGIDIHELHYRQRLAETGVTDREAPDGPDTHHHFLPTGLP